MVENIEQEFRELEMKLWRELGEQRKREREQAREGARE